MEAERTGMPVQMRMRVEVLVSFMPTATCMQLIRLCQELLIRYPDQLRLDVYKAGEQPDSTPTDGFAAAGKHKKVPSAFVNGRCVASAEVPPPEAVDAVVREELARGPSEWQA
jgi:hypothetical protein